MLWERWVVYSCAIVDSSKEHFVFVPFFIFFFFKKQNKTSVVNKKLAKKKYFFSLWIFCKQLDRIKRTKTWGLRNCGQGSEVLHTLNGKIWSISVLCVWGSGGDNNFQPRSAWPSLAIWVRLSQQCEAFPHGSRCMAGWCAVTSQCFSFSWLNFSSNMIVSSPVHRNNRAGFSVVLVSSQLICFSVSKNKAASPEDRKLTSV